METDDRQAAWYRAVRDGTPRGRHYGEPLTEDPPIKVAEVEPEPPPVLWTDAPDA